MDEAESLICELILLNRTLTYTAKLGWCERMLPGYGSREKLRAVLRVFAGLLSVGGIVWSLFVLALFFSASFSRAVGVFGPGLLVTIGYLVRATMANPSETAIRLWMVRVIWGFSALVQGTWLAAFTYILATERNGPITVSPFGVGIFLWWGFATGVSIFAMMREPADEDI